MKKYLIAIMATCWAGAAFEQPAVRNEPRHHNVFENEYIRILDVFLAPKDTTQFHVHATPSIFTTFTKTITSSQLPGQQPVRSTSVAGGSWYDSLVTPRVHRVWNDDTTWFHVMDIELVSGKPHVSEPVLQNEAIQLLFDEPLVRAYHVKLAPGGSVQLPSSKSGYLVLSLGEGAVTFRSKGVNQYRLMKEGHYSWISPGEEQSITNNDKQPAIFTFLQFK
jgi:quercetin dioxygenase-like cupin family protein